MAEKKARRNIRNKVVRRARPDSEINTSDIPPLTERFFSRAVRNPLFQPARGRKLRLSHPGMILREECLKPVGLSARALAKALHMPLAEVNPVLMSRCGISADMAVLLSVYFGTSDSYWSNLQGHYDLEVAKDRVRERAARITPHERAKTGAFRRPSR